MGNFIFPSFVKAQNGVFPAKRINNLLVASSLLKTLYDIENYFQKNNVVIHWTIYQYIILYTYIMIKNIKYMQYNLHYSG